MYWMHDSSSGLVANDSSLIVDCVSITFISLGRPSLSLSDWPNATFPNCIQMESLTNDAFVVPSVENR
ncbi:hypothetical protein PPL_08423 [Heterostelium album PN500]|uniref:Uncharacterized protein n=1 Tax=Heterostelium pallidum (strain ATCC 26659 / Pp 5 / PN500) TaxID=670386 RepID=D3BI55_HETP5|nr:hypothetical protein PPL_08423 [Heterostelium album PN500]EFA78955.1 hypothetical protein PPL_08423 [Heterostelium album PN500]|eukprot:XP_020431079.1 hypothetical protein PPL_08423 [Heterostelium album PN500]